MDTLQHFIHFILHLDVYLAMFFQHYGSTAYAILFLIIFCETGLVVTPFLPGDSLLFAAGALAASQPQAVNLETLISCLIIAAILGDSSNYWIGRKLGRRLFNNPNSRIFKRQYLLYTEKFYTKYGVKTVILARFLPILRTFAPFVAGVAKMAYPTFLRFSMLGGVLWIGLLSLAGYWFGRIPVVKNNFSIVVAVIIIVSVLPALREALRAWKNRAKS